MRVLVLSSRLTPRRRAAFQGLAPGTADFTFVAPDALSSRLADHDAIVVDGRPGPHPIETLSALRAAVERGMPMVAIGAAPAAPGGFWADLLGVVSGPEPSLGEYVATVTDAHSHISDRAPGEFAVLDGFVPLVPVGAGKVIVNVRVALRDHAAVVESALGAGRVVACGLGNGDDALRAPGLVQILARALRPDLHCCGRQIGVGIAGYGPLGGTGYHHGLGVTETEGIALIAVADPNVERRKMAEADFPSVRTYASTGELALDDDVEVVFVAAPAALHAALALDLLRAGKHVVCEKPLCLTVAEADQLIATASAERRMLTVYQNRRWDADFVALRRAAEAGLLGEVFNVETFVGGYEHPCRTWHSDTGVSGGAGYDWGSHHVDWILQLLGGSPRSVQAHGHKRVWHDVTNADQLRVRMVWSDGREAEFLQSDVAAVRRPKFYVQGTAGTLVGHYRTVTFEQIVPGRGYVAREAHHAEAPAELLLARYETAHGISETRLPLPTSPPFAFHRNLADHLHLGEPLAVTPESVRRVIAVLEAAQRSSTMDGAPVAIEGEAV
jgi:predicted dehydrogenase